MKKTTPSGLTTTAAPFWLVWLPPPDGGPERFPHLKVSRPRSGNGEPLSEAEALSLWLTAGAECTASPEAEEYLIALRDSHLTQP